MTESDQAYADIVAETVAGWALEDEEDKGD